jgi:Cytochrome c554 and c-prime
MLNKNLIRHGFVVISAMSVIAAGWWLLVSQRHDAIAQDTSKPLPKPPEGQTYLGTKVCASCHLEQYMAWKETKHAKGFEVLPAKYRADDSCLKCHSTGQGEKTGFVSIEATPTLQGTSCEACHTAGSKHAEIAKSFGNKKLSKDEESYVRSTIYKLRPKNACVECHTDKAHKKHPPYDKAN